MAKKTRKASLKEKSWAKKGGKAIGKRPARPLRISSRKKPPKPSRIQRQAVIRETFSLPARSQFKLEPIAPPEEPMPAARLASHARQEPGAIPNSVKASAASLVLTALIAAFLLLVMGMGAQYVFGLSLALFVGLSISAYTILSTSG